MLDKLPDLALFMNFVKGIVKFLLEESNAIYCTVQSVQLKDWEISSASLRDILFITEFIL